jgi:hypothetical protein
MNALTCETSLSEDEAEAVIRLLVMGADAAAIGKRMAGWSAEKTGQAWQLAAEYFRQCSHINRDFELGRALARLNLLFQNSLQIQDFKSCLSIQKEINKILSLKSNDT